jgi:D-serine deaminase-like pyridoxal phosphate-dependent protein
MQHPGLLHNLSDMETPCLLFYADRIRKNTEKVLDIAGSAARLWPHIKTHKTVELVEDLLLRGVTHFKCATIAEAELLARAGADEVLIAYPLVGPNIPRFAELAAHFGDTRFSTLVESAESILELSDAIMQSGTAGGIFIDLDVGMGRTGIEPDDDVLKLCRAVSSADGLDLRGLHAYDGHNRHMDLDDRKKACGACMHDVRALKKRIEADGIDVPHMIFGGTPTFPCYAAHADADLSPGTAFLFDWGYATSFPDLPFEPAAFVLGRVISARTGISFTLDVGSKAIATDPQGPRGIIVEYPDAVPSGQSEEHWVFDWKATDGPRTGDAVLIAPAHVCPTVNLYENALLINGEGSVFERWRIVGRTRKITI